MYGPLYGSLGPLGATWRKLVAAGSTLLDGLVSYWPLNEVSGTRYDVVGDNDLTDNNTVGSVLRGPEGTAASLVAANSEYLSDAGLVTDVGGGSFSWAAWIKNDPASANCSYAGQALDGLHVVRIYSDTGVGGRISTTVYNHPTDVTASVTGYSGDGWRLVVGGYDSASQKTFISVNGAAKTVSANTSAMIANIQSVDFWIGRADYPGYSTMQTGASGFWSAVLTDEQIATLFASGNGLRYSELPAGLLTGLVSWWELDEVSGVRYDSHGSNDLTDNNTVDCEYQGPLGAVASTVEANSEYLSSTSSDFTPVGSFSASLWVYITSPDICLFMGKEFTDPQAEWSLLTGAGGTLEGRFWGGGLTQAGGPGAWGARPGNWLAQNLNRWWLLTYVYDATAHTVTMYLNDAAGTPASTGVRTLSELGGAFTLLGGARSAYDTNKAASAGFWTKALSGAEVTELFNNGAGLRYADLSDGLKTGLVSWWNLDEASGVRYDSHGTNHLTDNNTVGSVINAGGAMDGAAASFVKANGEYLASAAFTKDFSAGWTASVWVKESSLPVGDWVPAWLIERNHQWNGATATIEIKRVAVSNTVYYAASVGDGAYTCDIHSYHNALPYSSVLNRWVNVVISFNPDGAPNNLRLWVNGRESVSSNAPTLPGPLYNGAAQSFKLAYTVQGAVAQIDGQMDETVVWERVLTDDEVAEWYAAGRGKFYPFTEA